RKEPQENLYTSTFENTQKLVKNGITTIEIKSGYGLSIEDELKMLRAINQVKNNSKAEIVPTFLGAHMKPRDFEGSNSEYLEILVNEIFPILKEENLSNRIDIFTEQSAFSVEESRIYLQKAKENGFEITIHADQFTPGGSHLAVEFGALSA